MTMTDVLSRLVDTTAFHLQKDAFWLDFGLERRLDIDAKTIGFSTQNESKMMRKTLNFPLTIA